ncbi:MAG: hypothetical protein KatS3mg129_1319 [Leptospiraceae bacterium]|nr:MAG: hypothetical protein KatS3mg129_1319 [Leptospiraceae bacterium]
MYKFKNNDFLKLTLFLILLTYIVQMNTSCKESQKKTGIEGLYRVEGKNPDGTEYRGNVTITKIGENQYKLHWKILNDEFEGTGKLEGKILTVDWGQEFPVIYEIQVDGSLKGTWNNGTATENLYPL